MAVNLTDRMGRRRARDLLEQSFAQFQADAAVVGAGPAGAAQRRRPSAAHCRVMHCHLGDIARVPRPAHRAAAAEKEAARAGAARRRDAGRRRSGELRRGDVIAVPTGRRAGLAVVLDPGVGLRRHRPPAGGHRRRAGRAGCPRATSAARCRRSAGSGWASTSTTGRRTSAGTSPPPRWPRASPRRRPRRPARQRRGRRGSRVLRRRRASASGARLRRPGRAPAVGPPVAAAGRPRTRRWPPGWPRPGTRWARRSTGSSRCCAERGYLRGRPADRRRPAARPDLVGERPGGGRVPAVAVRGTGCPRRSWPAVVSVLVFESRQDAVTVPRPPAGPADGAIAATDRGLGRGHRPGTGARTAADPEPDLGFAAAVAAWADGATLAAGADRRRGRRAATCPPATSSGGAGR